MVAAFVEDAPEFTIKNGIACIRAQSDDLTLCWHMPLYQFRIGVADAMRVIHEYDASGVVVQFPGHG